MSNKKQSSIDWLISCVTEDQMVKSKSLNEWLEIFEQAKSMHKKEIKQAIMFGDCRGKTSTYATSEQYYNETFGGENESNH